MASVKIVGLVAAHFSSEGRRDLKDRFHGCLDSIVDQSRPLDKFYLSWSHDEDIEWDVKSDIRDRFEEFKNKMSCRCEILEQGQRMQQFEHYQILYKFMEEEGCYHEDCNNRLIFGDIDDFWDPKRVEVVYDTIFASLEKDMFVIQISSKYDKYGTHIDPYGTHIDPDGIEKGKYEYWLTIIKFSIFAKFFKEADERYLKSPWCDLAFGNFMHRGNLTGSHTWKYLEDSKAEELVKEKGIYMYHYTGNGSEREGHTYGDKIGAKVFLSRRLCEVYPEKLDPSKLELHRGYESSFKFNLKRPISIDDIEKIENDINEIDDMITVTGGGSTSTPSFINSVDDEAANITWIQTNVDIEVKFRFNVVVASKQIKVKFKSDRLLVIVPEGTLSSKLTNVEEEMHTKFADVINNGAELFDSCTSDESTWSVEKTKDGKSELTITLAKSEPEKNWPMLLRG